MSAKPKEPMACCGGQAVKLGRKVRDPLCGRAVDVDSPHRLERHGHGLRFCSEACRSDYARALDGVLVPGVAFTCDLHPAWRQDEPGVCGICGRPLAPTRIAEQRADASAGRGMLKRLRAVLHL